MIVGPLLMLSEVRVRFLFGELCIYNAGWGGFFFPSSSGEKSPEFRLSPELRLNVGEGFTDLVARTP